jgi:hypothetical protein
MLAFERRSHKELPMADYWNLANGERIANAAKFNFSHLSRLISFQGFHESF